jgi:hypothetical protein
MNYMNLLRIRTNDASKFGVNPIPIDRVECVRALLRVNMRGSRSSWLFVEMPARDCRLR